MFVRTNDGREFAVIEQFNTPQSFLAWPAYALGSASLCHDANDKPRLLRKAGCVKIANSDGVLFHEPRAI